MPVGKEPGTLICHIDVPEAQILIMETNPEGTTGD